MCTETDLLIGNSQVVTTYTDRCYIKSLRIMPQIAFIFYIVNFPRNYITYIICVFVCLICLPQETETVSLYNINRHYAEFILCEVRSEIGT